MVKLVLDFIIKSNFTFGGKITFNNTKKQAVIIKVTAAKRHFSTE